MKVLVNDKAYRNSGFGLGIIKRTLGYSIGGDTNIFGIETNNKELDKEDYTLIVEDTVTGLVISFYKDDEFVPVKRFLADTLKDSRHEEIAYDFLEMTLGKQNLNVNLLGLHGRPLF